jgi:hypothetical protein
MMLLLVLGWASQAFLALILAFAIKGKFARKYAIFYSYVAGLLLIGLIRYYFRAFQRNDYYYPVYWSTQFLIDAGGYCVLWQLYAHTLARYPGTAKVARVVVSSLFAVVSLQFFDRVISDQASRLINNPVGFERDLYSAQALLLILLLLLVWYYGVPLGRNSRGMLIGYGLLIATRLVIMTLRSSLGTPFSVWWRYLEPMSYFAATMVWAMSLRTYDPNPVSEHEIELEQDYQLLARRTSRAITQVTGYLTKGLMP